jgi:hypothetical protein
VVPLGQRSHALQLGQVRLELGRRTGDEIRPGSERDPGLLLDVLAGDALYGAQGAHDRQTDHAEATPLLPQSSTALRDHLERRVDGLQGFGDGPALRTDRVDRAVQSSESRPDVLDRRCREGVHAPDVLDDPVVAHLDRPLNHQPVGSSW